MSQAESFIKQKSNDDYVGSQKNVKLSQRYFKQTHSVVLIKLKAHTQRLKISSVRKYQNLPMNIEEI